jgi:hypothetical protein
MASMQGDSVQRLRDLVILEPEVVALSPLGWDGVIRPYTPPRTPKGDELHLGIEASGFSRFGTATVGGRRVGTLDTSMEIVLSARVALLERPGIAAMPDSADDDYVAAKERAAVAIEAMLASILRYSPDPNPGDPVTGTSSAYPARPAGNDARMWSRIVPVQMDSPMVKDSILARLFVNLEFQLQR